MQSVSIGLAGDQWQPERAGDHQQLDTLSRRGGYSLACWWRAGGGHMIDEWTWQIVLVDDMDNLGNCHLIRRQCGLGEGEGAQLVIDYADITQRHVTHIAYCIGVG